MSEVDFSSMSDEDFNAALMADATEEAEATVTTDATDAGDAVTTTDAEPPAEQQQAEQTATAQLEQKDWNPDGPGDRGVALRQERERRQAVEARLREYEAEQQRQAAQAAEYQRQAAIREQLENTYDPEEQARIVNAYRQQDQQQYEATLRAVDFNSKVNAAYEVATETIPDFLQVMEAAKSDPDKAALIWNAATSAHEQGRNPVLAAYRAAKSMRSPEEVQAEIDAKVQAEVAKRLPTEVQAVLQKQRTPDIKGHDTIGHVSALTPGTQAKKRPRDMTDAELEAELRS